MPSAGFEPAIPVIELLQNYALECTATRIDSQPFNRENIMEGSLQVKKIFPGL
jgi:hypothetical protein